MGDASPEMAPAPDRDVVARLFPIATARVYQYVDLLAGDAVTRGLLGPREAGRIWPRHVLNCAVIAPAFAPDQRVCDLGSGAGLPGVVLALARPDLSVTLVDPLLRRVTFLRDAVASLDLANVEVFRGRAEEMAGVGVFDIVTARAVAPLGRLAGWAFPLLGAAGELIAIKGRTAADELSAAEPALRALGAGRARIESFGHGVVDPPTVVVRIESGGG